MTFRHTTLMAAAVAAAVGLTMSLAMGGGPGGGGAGRGPGGGGMGGAAAPAATQSAGSPIADGAQPVKLADGFGFTEGSTSDKDGNVFFVDQNNDKILEWVFEPTPEDPTKGHLATFLNPAGRSNGMCFDNKGNLISCADENNELWQINAPFPKLPADAKVGLKPADLKIDVLIKNYDPATKALNPAAGGKQLDGPNDVFVVPAGPLAGGIYITDPFFARSWWTNRPGGRNAQQPGKYVYFLSADRKTLTPVVMDLTTPNGIVGTPDGKTLYVADMDGRKTFSYTIKDDGTLADKKQFCAVGSDGMTIDSDGNVYTTNSNARQGVQIFNKEGTQIGQISIGSANCCFGGKDGNVLFICANGPGAVYGIKMKTHRVGPQ